MLFNSFVFAGIFLPITLLIFWSMPTATAKRAVLIIGSLLFYGYWLPAYLVLLLLFVVVAWLAAILIEKSGSQIPLYITGLILFGSLAFYKYSGFIGQVAVDLGLLPSNYHITQYVLPLGISFIVFQSMGYVIDVSRKEFPAEKQFFTVLLFKSFFPQLIAGPICRGHELMPQLKGNYYFRPEQFTSGLAIFALGLFVKEFLADGLSPLVDGLYVIQEQYSFESSWAASIGFGGQIYADFWGYSTMAVGLARMFSIDIPTNFNLPYASLSLREFWRRWHITLSEWLRDYLYKVLGGSRHGQYKMIRALLITMLLGGLWHGANYTFLIWGLIHGLALVLEHLFSSKQVELHSKRFMTINGVIGFFYTFLVVFIAWVFFRANDVAQALKMVSGMFSPPSLEGLSLTTEISQVLFLVLTLFILQFPIEKLLTKLRREQLSPSVAVIIAFWAIIASIILGSPSTVPFIYFQF